MKQSSQNQSVDTTPPAMPEQVSVAMAEIAENMREGLLALAVGAGLQVMHALMDAELEALLKLRDQGVINDEALRRVQRELDLERLRIGVDGDGLH